MIKIGFSTHRKNLLSSIIRKFTKSQVSHVWLVFDDPTFKRQMVIEASETGIVMTPFDVFVKKNDVIAIVEPKVDISIGLQAAGGWLGAGYDFLGLFGTLFVIIGRWLKRKWRNPLNNSRWMFCSEFIVRVLQESSVPGAEMFDPPSTTPQDLLDFLR